MLREERHRLGCALAQLPWEQREAVLLHAYSGLRFREVAAVQGISLSTAQGRYRYGASKLRALLDGDLRP